MRRGEAGRAGVPLEWLMDTLLDGRKMRAKFSGGHDVWCDIWIAIWWPQGLCQNWCLCVWMAAKCVPSVATVALVRWRERKMRANRCLLANDGRDLFLKAARSVLSLADARLVGRKIRAKCGALAC